MKSLVPATASFGMVPASRLLGALIGGVAALLALAVPAGYFALSYAAQASSLQTKAEIKAVVINRLIHASPDLWRFEQHRLEEVLSRMPVNLQGERAEILEPEGQAVASSSAPLRALMVMSRQATLSDAGRPVAVVHMEQSMSPLLAQTAISGLLGAALGGWLLATMRRQQRQERARAAVVYGVQERARVALQSIADGVVTTDLQGRVQYLNPVAERLLAWTSDEALGRPLPEVCLLVDEHSRRPLPFASRLHAVMQDVGVARAALNEAGRVSAILLGNGQLMAVEESLAPLLDAQGVAVGCVMVFRDVTVTRQLSRQLSWEAAHDALTGLVNRREFEQRLESALRSAHNAGTRHVMCYLDLDQFKLVNDTCGHAAGDAMLKQLGAALQGRLRESDTLARLGGDEFGVLFLGCGEAHAEHLANDLLSTVRSYCFLWQGRSFTVGVSIGLVAITADTSDCNEIFTAADTACFAAKEQGRNRICTYQASDGEMLRRRAEMGWAARLRRAIDEDRLVLYYQSYLALRSNSGRSQHVEVLLRLRDEEGQLVPPGSFLPAAERYNVMPEIDRWVVSKVFERYEDLALQLGSGLTCAINLSGTTLNSEGIFEFIRDQASKYRLPAGAICFEITETAAIHNLSQAMQFMRAVKALGFKFALDDFGIGSSSLAYLKNLPVDYLKIDGSFVRNMVTDAIDAAMVETMNRVGHIMGLQTVGEFAETPAVINSLRMLGVDYAQGYGVHKPEPLPPPLSAASPAHPLAVAQSRSALAAGLH